MKSLVVLSCGLRETSRVDYTERRKSERILIVFFVVKIRRGGGDFVPPHPLPGGPW